MGITLKRGKDFKLVDPGIYQVVIDSSEKKAGKDGKPPWLSWKFKIESDDEFDGQTILSSSDLFITPKNRLGQIYTAVTGKTIKPTSDEDAEFAEDEEICDTDDFIGERVRIFVEHQVKGDKTYANVKSVLPLKKKKKAEAPAEEPPKKPAKPAKPAPETEEEEDEAEATPPAKSKPGAMSYDSLNDDEDE